MEYKSITFDMNKPMVQQITEPLNSVYGVAVKVYKDGEEVDVKPGELSVGGQAASGQVNGFNTVELSSDNSIGMKQLEVEAAKLPIIDTTLTQSYRFKNTFGALLHRKLWQGGDSLSVFGIDREIELNGADLTASLIDYGSTSPSLTTYMKYGFTLSGPNISVQYIFAECPLSNTALSDNFWKNDYVGKFWLYDDEHTIVDSVKVDQYTSITDTAAVARNKTLCCDATISMKYGYQHKFPLQVVQTDTNYFEI